MQIQLHIISAYWQIFGISSTEPTKQETVIHDLLKENLVRFQNGVKYNVCIKHFV